MTTKPSLLRTAQDHRAEGSGPPKILVENPDKCRAELFNDDQLLAYLRENQNAVEKIKKKQMGLEYFIETYQADLKYLDSVNRLPEEFKKDLE